VTNSYGCISVNSADIIINTKPNCPPGIDLPDITTPGNTPVDICSPITDPDTGDTFTASICNNPKNGTINTPIVSDDGKNVCVTYTPNLDYNGKDSICITVCDQGGLCSSSTSVITVTLITLVATPTSVTCNGNSDGMITLQASGGTNQFTYQWTGPNNFSATTKDLVGLAGGIYHVKVTDTNGEYISTSVTVIEAAELLSLNTLPTAETRTMSLDGTTILGVTMGSINLTLSGGTAPYSYHWTGPDNFAASSADLANLVGGNYVVIATDANGCSMTKSVIVDVQAVLSEDESCQIVIPNVFTPNGDGIHDYFEIDCLYNYENVEIEIFNRNGNLLFKRDHYGNLDYWGSKEKAFWNGHSENSLNFMGSELPVGTYYYILKLSNGKIYTGFIFLGR
jgi:gliding motility-associated-like protein